MKIFQRPNTSLTIMLIAGVVGRFTTGFVHTLSEAVFIMAGTIWSYGEATKGINGLRKLLGLVVLAYIFLRLMRLFGQPIAL